MVATESPITVGGRPATIKFDGNGPNIAHIVFKNISHLAFPPIAIDDPDVEFMKYALTNLGMQWACMLMNGKNYYISESNVFDNTSNPVGARLSVPYCQPLTENRKTFLDRFDIPYKTLTNEHTKKLYMVTQIGYKWTLSNWRQPLNAQAKIADIPQTTIANFSITLKPYYHGNLPLAVRCIGRLLDIEWVLVNEYYIMSQSVILMASLQELGFIKRY